MRITFVSAHYPPNFVSGGTLQPQRLARGLRARGHEVRVFAGHLDSKRAPLESWEERDATGLPVRWIVTTPWMDWADEENYDNERVTARFTAELAKHPADVVHLHALQTLGVGLVEAAKRSGAATVLTMHDFWWVCARQFLVDRTHRPCSLVVACGDCPCEDGRAHLDRRAERLAAALQAADLVLAPSRSAAEVLRANGVDPRRLEVDENGMDHPTPAAAPKHPPHRAGRPVVLRYTGGSNTMKGADVLLDAVHELGPSTRLRVIAHGIEDAVERDGRSVAGTCLEVAPPYPPDQLDEVLAATDVLLLPSVMRESHSLVTREALLRGVPVLATDTIGPEEVVVDGVNGLVIPAAEPSLLRAAMASLEAPEVLERLQVGASTPPPVRTTEEQLQGLEQRFEALRERPRIPEPRRPSRVLFLVGIDGAPMRYRARLPAEAIGLRGVPSDVRHYRDPDVEALAAAAEVIVVYRVPATPQVLDLIERRRARGATVVFDVDDLIFDPDLAAEIPALRLLPEDEAALWLEGVRRYRTTMEACDAYIGSTPRLVEHAREVVGIDSHLFENGVGTALGAASDIALRRRRRPGPLRIGYLSGTTTHDDDWRYVEGAVIGVLEERADVELWLAGHLQPTDALLDRVAGRVRRLPFLPWYELPEVLRDLDINLAPLEPASRFNDAKSAIKWLEAALVATPTIASPSAPFVDVVGGGRYGWLADTPEAWATVLRQVLDDPEARALAGARARRTALLRWSPHLQGERYLDILASITSGLEGGRRRPSAAWAPLANDEPPEPHPRVLEPYPPELRGSIRRLRRHRRVPLRTLLRTKRQRLVETWGEEGPWGTLRGAGRLVVRVGVRLARLPLSLARRLRR
ncbi:MAG: glycosyltransferase [Acidimicrobiia bacterium]